MASANVLIRFAFSAASARGVRCSGLPHQHNDVGAVCTYVGGLIGVTHVGTNLVAVPKGLPRIP